MGFRGFPTQSMRSSDIEALTVITPRAEQLSNERLVGDSGGGTCNRDLWQSLVYREAAYTLVWDMHVYMLRCMYMCMGGAVHVHVYGTCTYMYVYVLVQWLSGWIKATMQGLPYQMFCKPQL